jgi:hypothetical protein
MSAAHRRLQDRETGDDPDPRPAEAMPVTAGTPPFDWQVLLLRYLPQTAGSAHVIKRLAPR